MRVCFMVKSKTRRRGGVYYMKKIGVSNDRPK